MIDRVWTHRCVKTQVEKLALHKQAEIDQIYADIEVRIHVPYHDMDVATNSVDIISKQLAPLAPK